MYICNTNKHNMTITNIDTTKLKLVESDFSDYSILTEQILEDGSAYVKDQFVDFDYDGKILSVSFNTTASGNVFDDPGDYWTAPYSEVNINDLDIEITQILLDESPIEITKESKAKLVKLIEELL